MLVIFHGKQSLGFTYEVVHTHYIIILFAERRLVTWQRKTCVKRMKSTLLLPWWSARWPFMLNVLIFFMIFYSFQKLKYSGYFRLLRLWWKSRRKAANLVQVRPVLQTYRAKLEALLITLVEITTATELARWESIKIVCQFRLFLCFEFMIFFRQLLTS